MGWFRDDVRCDRCCGTGIIYDYYDYDENGQPKQKTCPKCNGRGYVEVEIPTDD